MIATKSIRQRPGTDVRAMAAAAGIAAALLIGGAGGYTLGNLVASSNLAVQPANPSVASSFARTSSQRIATSLDRIHGDGGARDPWSR